MMKYIENKSLNIVKNNLSIIIKITFSNVFFIK